MEYMAVFVMGVVLGAAAVFCINRFHRKDMEKSFSALSLEALTRNSGEFLKLAGETLSRQTQTAAGELNGKKQLIDQTLEAIRGDLQRVEGLITEFDGKREKAFGDVSAQLRLAAEQTARLQETTGKLQTALANTRVRGQWGERMAEDILQIVGFVENVNYVKQSTQESGTRPDYTFLLPQNLKVNMDVKFPLDNYLKYLQVEAESDRESYKQKFLADTRQKVKEVKSRDYINPEENTVDYALMFVPNEQVFCFIYENGASILDEALQHKVIICSPVTLFAILCVMRQAVQVFSLERTAADILSLLNAFSKQWEAFKGSMEKMGRKIEEAYREYNTLVATRSRQLERPLMRIEELKQRKGIQAALQAEAEPVPQEESGESKPPAQDD